MQKYVYSFQSAVGIFWIRPERDKSWEASSPSIRITVSMFGHGTINRSPQDAASHGTPASKSNLNCISSGIGSFRASSKLAVLALIGFFASNSLRRR
jgi:hypothetical protein